MDLTSMARTGNQIKGMVSKRHSNPTPPIPANHTLQLQVAGRAPVPRPTRCRRPKCSGRSGAWTRGRSKGGVAAQPREPSHLPKFVTFNGTTISNIPTEVGQNPIYRLSPGRVPQVFRVLWSRSLDLSNIGLTRPPGRPPISGSGRPESPGSDLTWGT